MEESLKRVIRKRYKVIVGKCSLSDRSKCNTKRCKKHDKYGIFIGEDTKLSTLYSLSCSIHLPLQIEKALEQAKIDAEKQILIEEEYAIKKAKELLNKK